MSVDYTGQFHDRQENPGVPDTALLFGANAGTLVQIAKLLEALVLATIRGESPAPSLFHCLPAPAQHSFPVTVRTKMQLLVISVTQAATVTLLIGNPNAAATPYTFNFPNGDTRVFPLPITIEPGVDVTINTTVGSITAAYLTGYVEPEVKLPNEAR